MNKFIIIILLVASSGCMTLKDTIKPEWSVSLCRDTDTRGTSNACVYVPVKIPMP